MTEQIKEKLKKMSDKELKKFIIEWASVGDMAKQESKIREGEGSG